MSKTLKKISIAILCSIVLMLGVGNIEANAKGNDGSTTVYVTSSGKCYHTKTCQTIKKSKTTSMSLQDAVDSGYKACSKCNPPKLDSTSTKSSKKSSLNDSSDLVWISATGSKYHSKNNCGKMNPNKATQISEDDAIAKGLEKCSKCW